MKTSVKDTVKDHLRERKLTIQPFLLSQGLVARDPELPLDRTLIPSPPTRPKHPVFDNEDMGKVKEWRINKSEAFVFNETLHTFT